MATVKEMVFGKTTGLVKKGTLQKDIARGVKFLNEAAYSNIVGATKSSLLFYLEVKKCIDLSQVYRVELENSTRHWYSLKLYTRDGYTVLFKGLSFGFYGEGSRGTVAVLNDLGFGRKQIKRIFEDGNTSLLLQRRVTA
jgi:hypothetical protein